MKNQFFIFVNFLPIFLCFQFSYSQSTQKWVQRYNGTGNNNDAGNFIAADNSGNVYVTGNSTGIGTRDDYTTIKYNSSGTQQWVQRYNGPSDSNDIATCIAVDGSGNVYVTGRSRGSGTNLDYATVKYNSSGTQQWVQRYNGPGNNSDAAFFLTLDFSGNVYVTGYSTGVGTNLDYATVKYSSAGVQQWVQRYNGPGNNSDQAVWVSVDTLGNVYITGLSTGSGTSLDYATIKYSTSGIQQWVQRYNGAANDDDVARSVGCDNSGNVFMTGLSFNTGSSADYVTIKYNSTGTQQWVRTCNGTGNNYDEPFSLAVDDSGDVYVTGSTSGTGSGSDYTTIKYNTLGVLKWIQNYNGIGNGTDIAFSIVVDNSRNAYVTGFSLSGGSNYDYTTIKYNFLGMQEWIQRYNGPGTGSEVATSIAVDDSSNVYVTGYSTGVGTLLDYATLKYSQLFITNPTSYTKWISGQSDTIKWIGGDTLAINLKCILNYGTALQSEFTIANNVAASQKKFIWTLPDSLLSFRSKIIAENYYDATHRGESDVFRIKPYLLTRVIVNSTDSTYYEFKKDRDQWKFVNSPGDMFPLIWYNKFNYQGIDPFTGNPYSQTEGLGVFKKAKSPEFPDWISWVNTFTVSACYLNTQMNIYSPTALMRWDAVKQPWKGSCFGIATANAIVFRDTSQFFAKYSNFPRFDFPFDVISGNTPAGDTVKKIINELFTHQFGQPHDNYIYDIALKKTPNETLREIKTMLLSENDSIKVLGIINNGIGGGGHAINVYKVKQDAVQPKKYYIYVYDNDNAGSLTPITIDTSANGGKGSWSTLDRPGWGGSHSLSLVDPALTYLTNPALTGPYYKQSPFTLSSNILQIFNTTKGSISIKDQSGIITGFINNTIQTNIPNSFPLTILNGSETPPYGYELPIDNYSLEMNNFEADTVNAYFFSSNKSFSYQRRGATSTQTDKLYFDGGLSVGNPDAAMKTINLINILNETTQEKVFAISSINLIQNDSVKIQNQTSNNLKLTSYGSAKHYNIELNLAATTGLGKFTNVNINLPANTSHSFVPNWSDITNNPLIVFEDLGNNGTIDDTLILNSFKSLNLTALIEGFYDNVTNTMAADTVKIYLRNISSPYNIIDSAKSVLESNGNETFNFKNPANEIPYYIVLKHRNSLETWSKTPQQFTVSALTYDFTTAANKAYGDNMKQVDFSPIRFAVYNGDANQDGIIDGSDLSQVDNDAGIGLTGYVKSDLTGDDFVDASDISIVDYNAGLGVYVITP